MAVEDYVNAFETTLSSGYTSGSGSASLTSGTGLPASGRLFRLGIFDATSGALKVILTVTSYISTTMAVAAEGTDASASSGDKVRLILTAGAMNQIRQDLIQVDTYANLPSTTGQKKGNRFRCSDIPFEAIFDGAAWAWYATGGDLGALYVDTAEASTSTSYGDLATLDTVTFTLPATFNVTVRFMATCATNRANQVAFCVPNVDTVDATVNNNAIVFSSSAIVLAAICVYRVSLAAGSHTIKIRKKISDNSSSGNATWQSRLLTVDVG